MAKLNSKTDKTKKIIHLMVTTLCNRNCKYCCNKQYDLNNIPYITNEELKDAEILCITGGEPFMFSNPCSIAAYYKNKYPNIKKVYVYTSAYELALYLLCHNLYDIDGLNISIRDNKDLDSFNKVIKSHDSVIDLESNRLYSFNNLCKDEPEGFKLINRVWQKDFVPANDSIFRKV